MVPHMGEIEPLKLFESGIPMDLIEDSGDSDRNMHLWIIFDIYVLHRKYAPPYGAFTLRDRDRDRPIKWLQHPIWH